MTTIPDEWIEMGARAIFDAENDLDGDRIGTILHENCRVEVRDGDKGLGDTMVVCRAAARACLSAVIERVRADEREPHKPGDRLPGGLVVVPEEPTKELWNGWRSINCTIGEGGMHEFTYFEGDYGNWAACYHAMIAAAIRTNGGGET